MILRTRANVRSMTGVDCGGEAWAVVAGGIATLYTDFRYIPMAHRVAPWLKTKDIKKFTFPKFKTAKPSKPETRNSKLETRNSKLETRNSKLETRNSKLTQT